jgi:hypothetical protein
MENRQVGQRSAELDRSIDEGLGGAMTAIPTKVRIGTVACAIAAAAALTPVAVAQAGPAVPVPTSALGKSAGLISEAIRTPAAKTPTAKTPAANSSQSISASISASNSGPATIFIFQNVGWFENVNFQILVNVQAGGYGTVSA